MVMDSGKLKFADTRKMGSDGELRKLERLRLPISPPGYSHLLTQPPLTNPVGFLNSLDLPSTLLQLLIAAAVILTF